MPFIPHIGYVCDRCGARLRHPVLAGERVFGSECAQAVLDEMHAGGTALPAPFARLATRRPSRGRGVLRLPLEGETYRRRPRSGFRPDERTYVVRLASGGCLYLDPTDGSAPSPRFPMSVETLNRNYILAA